MDAVDALKEVREKLDEQYRKACEAIDIAISLSQQIQGGEFLFNIKPNEEVGSVALNNAKDLDEGQNGHKEEVKAEVLSVRDAIRDVYPLLPEYFKRATLIDHVKHYHPEFADKLTVSAVDSSIRKLIEEEVIAVKRKGQGRLVPAVYGKLKESAEKPPTVDEFFADLDEMEGKDRV